jgi:hypothetical protein
MPYGLGGINATGGGIWNTVQSLSQPVIEAGDAPTTALPSDSSWLHHYGLGIPSALDGLFVRRPAGSASLGLSGQVSPGIARDRASAARQIVVSAQAQLNQYAQWIRTSEGKAYLSWRTDQLKLPENQRTTGNWGKDWGLDGVLRGNKPRMVWRDFGAGQVWRFRCNVFATNHTYAAGFAVPVVATPNSMVTRYRAEVAGRRQAPIEHQISRYFDEVPFDQVQPGDWVIVGHQKSNGSVDYPHVVIAAGSLQNGNLQIAQAGSNPKPESTCYRVRNGKIEAVRDDGAVTVKYDHAVVLRPKLLRPTGPDGQRARNPRGEPD